MWLEWDLYCVCCEVCFDLYCVCCDFLFRCMVYSKLTNFNFVLFSQILNFLHCCCFGTRVWLKNVPIPAEAIHDSVKGVASDFCLPCLRHLHIIIASMGIEVYKYTVSFQIPFYLRALCIWIDVYYGFSIIALLQSIIIINLSSLYIHWYTAWINVVHRT
jgi:hypothetical protein